MHIMKTYLPGVTVIYSGDETTLMMTRDAVSELTEEQISGVCEWFLEFHYELTSIGTFMAYGEGDFYGEHIRNITGTAKAVDETVLRLAREAIANQCSETS